MSANNIMKKLFCGIMLFGLCFAPAVATASADCPECPPELDGSIFPGGSCENCKNDEVIDEDGSIFPGGSCDRCKDKRVSHEKVVVVDEPAQRTCGECPTPVFNTQNYVFAQPRYKYSERNCCDLAPFALTHVDFKLNSDNGYSPYSSHVGNYRFRIFGCRRQDKKAILNKGRVIQKDMAFNDVFKKSADKCYKVMEIPSDVCFADTTVALPEYVLTAEITNFFMNICDEYDWEKAQKKNRRNGTAEMTVTWRLMNLSQTKVFWKGITTGYAEVENGVYEGEIKLAEGAFADATARLNTLPGFENQLKIRQTPEAMAEERAALVAFDEKFNPGKCNFQKEIAYTHTCDYAPQPTCPAVPRTNCTTVTQPCTCTQPTCTCPQVTTCAPAKPKVEEFVDVKTETTTIQKKTITTTRVETPAPVCQQVCRPTCQTCPVQCTQECTQPKCRRVCTETCEEGKETCETVCHEDCSEPTPEVIKPAPLIEIKEPVVEEDGGVEIENVTVEPQLEEDGGVTDSYRIHENCIDEAGNVISDGSCTLIDDNWVDLEGYNVDSKLCIVDRPAYTELSPENMLKIRASVVEITNAKDDKGTGLIISDSFVLTSAGLVNKLQNTYDVKTINGDVVKAKAVRVNPSKNIALLHLEKPVTYTPISLNLDLPAIDQEGFISLGAPNEGEANKDYMDDSGKIYGYRYSDNLGTEIIVDTLVQKVSVGNVLIDKLGTVNGISNSAKQTKEGMDLFLPTETAIRSVGLSICEKLYEKKSPWEKPVYKSVTEQVKEETKAPEAIKEVFRK